MAPSPRSGSPRTRTGVLGSRKTRRDEQTSLLEKVGASLREMMPFLKAVKVTPESDQAAVASK